MKPRASARGAMPLVLNWCAPAPRMSSTAREGRGSSMVIVMQGAATHDQLRVVLQLVESSGFHAHINDGVERKVVAVLGEVDIDKVELLERFENLPGVEKVNLI